MQLGAGATAEVGACKSEDWVHLPVFEGSHPVEVVRVGGAKRFEWLYGELRRGSKEVGYGGRRLTGRNAEMEIVGFARDVGGWKDLNHSSRPKRAAVENFDA